MTQSNNNHAIIYTRQARQDSGTDAKLDNQVHACIKVAGEHGLSVENIITEVGSGSSLKRPGLRKVLDAAKMGQVSHIVVSDVTRLIRGNNESDWQHISKPFAEGDVQLLTRDGVFDFRAANLRLQLQDTWRAGIGRKRRGL